MSNIDTFWFENRDESTLDEKTRDAKFQKKLLALFKKIEEIKQTRTEVTVFPVATQAVDSQPTMVFGACCYFGAASSIGPQSSARESS